MDIAYHIMEVLIVYADKLLVMGSSKNTCVFNFAILLKWWKVDVRILYTVNHKKRDILFLTITLAKHNQFL